MYNIAILNRNVEESFLNNFFIVLRLLICKCNIILEQTNHKILIIELKLLILWLKIINDGRFE